MCGQQVTCRLSVDETFFQLLRSAAIGKSDRVLLGSSGTFGLPSVRDTIRSVDLLSGSPVKRAL
jgi:hypothetical protein